jgi:hypothetical protein
MMAAAMQNKKGARALSDNKHLPFSLRAVERSLPENLSGLW